MKILEDTPYSISVDEGNKGKANYLVISAGYFNSPKETKTTTQLLGLIELSDSSTGLNLYELVNDFLFKGDEGLQRRNNLMGISTDHATNMISAQVQE